MLHSSAEKIAWRVMAGMDIADSDEQIQLYVHKSLCCYSARDRRQIYREIDTFMADFPHMCGKGVNGCGQQFE